MTIAFRETSLNAGIMTIKINIAVKAPRDKYIIDQRLDLFLLPPRTKCAQLTILERTILIKIPYC